MMKSFFKKLAFVMALAMVVSLAAPAATTASAASDLKIAYQNGSAVSEINLAKVGDVEDLKFTGAPDYKKVGFEWTSSNPAVATVNQKGEVTAVAAGTAVVTIKIGTDRQASVKVNVVDLPTYTATMGLTRDDLKTEVELKVDGTIDLAFFGIKDYDKNRYNCNWYSVDDDVATVDQKGLITAVGEGKTVISLGVYNVVTGKKHSVQSCTVVVKGDEEATPTPVVKNNSFTVAQKDTDKFVLTFAQEQTAEAVKENLTVSVKIGEKNYPISFENVTVDGKDVTVTTYALFENDEVYTLTFADHTENCTIVLGDITRVGAKYYTGKNKDNTIAYVTEEEENDYVTLVPVLFDQFGNDVTAKYNLNNFDFTYEVSENVAPVRIFNDVFAFNAAGAAKVDITASWITDAGEFKVVEGAASFPVVKRGGVVLTLEKAGIIASSWFKNDDVYTDDLNALYSFTNDPESAVWKSNPTTTLTYYSDDTNAYYYTAVFADNRGNLTTSNGLYQFGTFTYESTNNEVLNITNGSGRVDILKPGRANILVYYTPADGTTTKKLVASTSVVVNPEPYPVRYEVTASHTTASHVIDEDLNNVTYTIKFYDQNGKHYTHIKGLEAIAPLLKVEARDTANTVLPVASAGLHYNDKVFYCTIDASIFQDDLGRNNYKQYSYKVTLDEADITKTIKTGYGVFSLIVKNTYEECEILRDFIESTAVGTKEEWTWNAELTNAVTGEEGDYELVTVPAIGEKAGTVPSNYKFNIALGGTATPDVAVKNIISYKKTGAHGTTKGAGFGATYLSTGNLPIARVPEELLVDNTYDRATTGHAGYVYYKVSAPTNTTVAGTVERNDAWGYADGDGSVSFSFNAPVITYKKDANGDDIVLEYAVDDEGNPIYDFNKETGAWEQRPVKDPESYSFKYAGNGTYTVTFYTTRTEGKNLYSVKTGSATVSNSQNQVKYLGLNPYFDGVTEYEISTTMADADVEKIILEQLKFSFDEILVGDYFEEDNYYDGVKIKINFAKSKITPSNDSITISTLAFDVLVDDGNGDTEFIYTSIVSVGARIKEK